MQHITKCIIQYLSEPSFTKMKARLLVRAGSYDWWELGHFAINIIILEELHTNCIKTTYYTILVCADGSHELKVSVANFASAIVGLTFFKFDLNQGFKTSWVRFCKKNFWKKMC